MRGFITQLEHDLALIEQPDRTCEKVDRSKLPSVAREGDFIVKDTSSESYYIDYEITRMRQIELRRMADTFFD